MYRKTDPLSGINEESWTNVLTDRHTYRESHGQRVRLKDKQIGRQAIEVKLIVMVCRKIYLG